MYSLHTKIFVALGACFLFLSAVSITTATTNTTGSTPQTSITGTVASLRSLSQDRQRVVTQKLTNLQNFLLGGTGGTGAEYRDMVSVLQCLQIPFTDSNQVSLTLLQDLSIDIDRDRQAIDRDITLLPTNVSSTDVRVSLIRQLTESTAQKYTNTLDALALSLQNEQMQAMQGIDRLITANKTLFKQLVSDKKLIDTMLLASTQRQQKMASQKTTLGFTYKQMDTIIANYREKMMSYVASGLQMRMDRFSKQYKDIIPFASFVRDERDEFLTAYNQQINDRFAQRLGDVSTGDSYIQRLNETVSLMKTQFYEGDKLQCGLLTSMTHAQRSNYRSIIADLNESAASLGSTTTVTTGSISLSSGFVDSLNARYHSSSKALLDGFTASVQSQVSLWKKAIRSEGMQISALQVRLSDYRQYSSFDSSTLQAKRAIKEEMISTIAQIQKQGILSLRSQKSLDRIAKELHIQK